MMIKVKTLQKFQTDLQCGMSIDEACRKHKISFKYACDNLPRAYGKRKRNYPANRKPAQKPRRPVQKEKYIMERNGHYYLRKYMKTSKKKRGKGVAFGTYKSMEDAVKVRDYCIEHGWKQHSIDEYCRILGVERCKNNRSKSRLRYH